MLTIQPNFTNYSVKTAFKGNSNIFDENKMKEEREYYRSKVDEFDKIMNDDYLPKTAKKGARIFKIVSEGIMKGLAVAWGASVSASMLKKFKTEKLSKWFEKVAKPAGERLKSAGSKLGEKVSQKSEKFKESKLANNVAEKFTKFVEKLDNTKLGHYVIEGFKYMGVGIKKLGKLVKKGIRAIIKPFKTVTYDKAAKVVSTTLGVGSGLAGAYEAGRNPHAPEAVDDIFGVCDDLLDEKGEI